MKPFPEGPEAKKEVNELLAKKVMGWEESINVDGAYVMKDDTLRWPEAHDPYALGTWNPYGNIADALEALDAAMKRKLIDSFRIEGWMPAPDDWQAFTIVVTSKSGNDHTRFPATLKELPQAICQALAAAVGEDND